MFAAHGNKIKVLFSVDRHTNIHRLMCLLSTSLKCYSWYDKGSQLGFGYKLSSPTHEMHNVSFQRSLEQHSVETLVISFGCQEGASHWLRETSCPYEMLLDPDRKVRTQLNIALCWMRTDQLFLNNALYLLNACSFTQRWAWGHLWGRYRTSGTCYCTQSMSWTTRSFPGGFHQCRKTCFRWRQPHKCTCRLYRIFFSEDLKFFFLIFCPLSLQLGGDFLLDEHGRMLFSHRCQSPIDRPSVQDILSALPVIVD